jgi:hypothetical protein
MMLASHFGQIMVSGKRGQIAGKILYQMGFTALTTRLKIDQPPSIAAFSSSRLSAKTLLATSNGDFDEIDAGRNSDIAEMA